MDADLNVILPVQRVEFSRLEAWMKKTLNQQDAVALEMTTNTWQLYNEPAIPELVLLWCKPKSVGKLFFFIVHMDMIQFFPINQGG